MCLFAVTLQLKIILDIEMRKFVILLLSCVMPTLASAQSVTLSLDSCLALAVNNNKGLSIAELKQQVAHFQHREAFTKYLPHVDGTGAYMRTGRELSLLNDDQKGTLQNVGTTVGTTLQGMAMQNPQLGQLVQSLGGIPENLVPMLNGLGTSITDAFRTDTRNVTAMALSLTQPLYMGGKIMAYNNITRYAEEIAGIQKSQKTQELVVSVEATYWQIVSLESKRRLAEHYKLLVDTLDYSVQQLIEQGVASKADGLSVKVKQNEADVTLIQIDNGLALSRMLLCQLCGIDINTDLHPADSDLEELNASNSSIPQHLDFSMRPELRSLDLLTKINQEKVKVTRADYLPKLALTANYMWTNPSLFNGFEKKMKGTWAIGAMLSVPLVDWGEGYYKVRASKIEARMTELTLDEAREKIELQATQCSQKVMEAASREETALRSLAAAEENLRYANVGMQEGVIPISNVIEAQTAWLSAHSTLLTARIDKRLAQVNLKRSLGTL